MRVRKIPELFNVLGVMKIGKKDQGWRALKYIPKSLVSDSIPSECYSVEGYKVILPDKKRGEKFRVTYTEMKFKDF